MSFLALMTSVELKVLQASQILKLRSSRLLCDDLVSPPPSLTLKGKPVV